MVLSQNVESMVVEGPERSKRQVALGLKEARDALVPDRMVRRPKRPVSRPMTRSAGRAGGTARNSGAAGGGTAARVPSRVVCGEPGCKWRLQSFRVVSGPDIVVCDGCSKPQSVGAEAHGCHEHDYDLCNPCFEAQRGQDTTGRGGGDGGGGGGREGARGARGGEVTAAPATRPGPSFKCVGIVQQRRKGARSTTDGKGGEEKSDQGSESGGGRGAPGVEESEYMVAWVGGGHSWEPRESFPGGGGAAVLEEWAVYKRSASYKRDVRRVVSQPPGPTVLVDKYGFETTANEAGLAARFAASEAAREAYEESIEDDPCLNHNKAIQHFLPRARTGGAIIVTCSCLHILSLDECIRHETKIQVLDCILAVVAAGREYPDECTWTDEETVKWMGLYDKEGNERRLALGYDDMCHMHPFLINLHARLVVSHPNHACTHVIRVLLKRGKFAVDRHHHNSHVKVDKRTKKPTRCATDYDCEGKNQEGAYDFQNTGTGEQGCTTCVYACYVICVCTPSCLIVLYGLGCMRYIISSPPLLPSSTDREQRADVRLPSSFQE